MASLKGVDITLRLRVSAEADDLGNPVWGYEEVTVGNVLISPSSDMEVTEALSLYGKKAKYTLSIPKGDAHDWENQEVEFFGERFRTIGKGLLYIEELAPGNWNKKVIVEYIDGEN